MGVDRHSEERFERLYEAHVRQIYAYFLRRVDAEAAQDLTSETFLVAWRRLKSVPAGERALPYLYGVARRVLANHRRSATRARRLFARLSWLRQEQPPTPERVVVRNHEDQQVLDALSRLRPDDQEILRLAVWEELAYADIAELLGCSTHAVAQRRYRAIQHLTRELGETGHTEVSIPRRTTKGVAR